MRLLAIRGGNLASLCETFDLNFEAEPLRSAGLFAITGETGAGKSTILDALCLALYDKFPRVAAPGASEGAPDSSGETLSAADPRAILRRGAGRGFAEVDFVARDGQRYRARCELLRARGKAAGRLQNRARGLWRIDDSSAVVEAIDSKIELVNERIVQLTDLTFDQFRRTALLAQGEFDAFLRADSKERADLLEKITGAEIYGVLSKRAYEQDRRAQQQLAASEERLGAIGVMPEAERASKNAESVEIEAQRGALAADRAENADLLRRHDALSQAQTKFMQAQAAHAVTERAAQHVAAQRETLAALARAEPLRAPCEDVLRAQTALADAQRTAENARAQAETADMALKQARDEESVRTQALAQVDREGETYAPLWKEAATLDTRIAALAQDAENARNPARDAARHARETREAHAERSAQQAETQAAFTQAREECDRLAPAQSLSERWREIDDWLEKRAELSKDIRAAQKALRIAQDELSRGELTRASFDEADRQASAARETLRAQIAARQQALAALNEEAVQRDDAEMAHAHEAALSLSRLAQTYDAARAQLLRTQEDADAFQRDDEALAARIAELQAGRARQAAEAKDAARLGDLADAAADPQALRLRAALLDETECPVCGARDHPFAQSGGAASELVAALRARREEAWNRLTQSDDELIAAQAHAAQLRARLDDAARRGAEAQRTMVSAAREYAGLRKTYDAAPAAIDTATPLLAAMLQELADKRAALLQKYAAARRLRDDLDQLRGEEADRRSAFDARRLERDALNLRMQGAGEERARLEAEMRGFTGRVDSLDRSLAPFLALCDLTQADLARDAASVRERMAAVGETARSARQRAESLDAVLRALDPEVAKLAAQREGAMEAARVAAATLANATRALDDTCAARAALLGGEATDAHRARFEEKRAAAVKARDTARDAVTEMGEKYAARQQSHLDAGAALVAARGRVEAADSEHTRALAEIGVDAATAAPLLALSSADVATLKSAVDTADADLAAARTAVAERWADLEEARAAAPSDTPRGDLAAREAALAQQLDALSKRLGALSEQIAQDERARQQAQGLAQEIDAARASQKISAEINAAIGSATGDKFRRFAQAVTLDELVALANQRLALFAKRYSLERSADAGALGLQIIDHDLGDERRSTRSLSGGERFLASLALALALAGLEGRNSFVDTLFIDEGFGALDSATLDVALDALENLQGQGRRVGVISHVESLQQRIAVKICVERRGGGVSVVRLRAPGFG